MINGWQNVTKSIIDISPSEGLSTLPDIQFYSTLKLIAMPRKNSGKIEHPSCEPQTDRGLKECLFPSYVTDNWDYPTDSDALDHRQSPGAF